LRTKLSRYLERKKKHLKHYDDHTLDNVDSEFMNAAPLEELERRIDDAEERIRSHRAKWPEFANKLQTNLSRILEKRRSQLEIHDDRLSRILEKRRSQLKIHDDRTLDNLDYESINAAQIEELERRLERRLHNPDLYYSTSTDVWISATAESIFTASGLSPSAYARINFPL
jgi:hypothetical protein